MSRLSIHEILTDAINFETGGGDPTHLFDLTSYDVQDAIFEHAATADGIPIGQLLERNPTMQSLARIQYILEESERVLPMEKRQELLAKSLGYDNRNAQRNESSLGANLYGEDGETRSTLDGKREARTASRIGGSLEPEGREPRHFGKACIAAVMERLADSLKREGETQAQAYARLMREDEDFRGAYAAHLDAPFDPSGPA